jgi:hypothetical protein
MEKKNAAKAKDRDVVLLHGRTSDGEGIKAIRSREDRIETAELRPIVEGKPILSGEVVRLLPREESPLLWNVEVQHKTEEESLPGRSGPPRVASESYRRHWSQIFEETEVEQVSRKVASKKRILN